MNRNGNGESRQKFVPSTIAAGGFGQQEGARGRGSESHLPKPNLESKIKEIQTKFVGMAFDAMKDRSSNAGAESLLREMQAALENVRVSSDIQEEIGLSRSYETGEFVLIPSEKGQAKFEIMLEKPDGKPYKFTLKPAKDDSLAAALENPGSGKTQR